MTGWSAPSATGTSSSRAITILALAVVIVRTAMLFAPLPPPVGGITSITAMLHRDLGGNPDVLFVQPVAKTGHWTRFIRPLLSAGRLVAGTLRVRPEGRIVFFCSSRASFWDKCVWACIVLFLRRSPALVMVAGNFPETFAASPRVAQWLARWLMRRNGLIVAAQSAEWADRYKGIFPGAAVTRVGATVDARFFELPSGSVSESPLLTLLFVGWIIHDKGITDLLDAIAAAAHVVRGRARTRLIGPLFGKDAHWRREIERRGISDLVDVVGPVGDRDALALEYRTADAFVFPSHYEGFPVALLEAAASGLPCVATDVGGVTDILDAGRAGVMVPPKDPLSLAAAIIRIVSDSPLRAQLGRAAAERARTVYSGKACLDSYRALLGLRALPDGPVPDLG